MTAMNLHQVNREQTGLHGSGLGQPIPAPKSQRTHVMDTTKFRRPTAWLLMAAVAMLSLAAIACATTQNDGIGANGELPILGEPIVLVTEDGSEGLGDTIGLPSSPSVVGNDFGSAGFAVPASAIEASGFYAAPAAYGISPVFTAQTSTANTGIWVTGQATLEIPADVAKVSIGVESREATVAESRQKAAGAMENVLAAIRETGVANDDIVTSYFNIQPQTVWVEVSDSSGSRREPRITGYIVNNTVRVTVRDIDLLGSVVDTAATAGGDLVRINSIQFTVDDPSVFGEQIREMAATDALAKANFYARVMGVTLGPMVFLTEVGSSVPMSRAFPESMGMMMDEGFARTPISAGDVSLSVTLQVVFAIAG